VVSLRNRIALAGGTVVFVALLAASLILYPALRANLTAQHDNALATVAQRAPVALPIAKRLASQAGLPTTDEKLDLGSTLMQIVDVTGAGPGKDFLPLDKVDVAVAAGVMPPYFKNASYQGVAYRVYTAPMPGADGVLVRTAAPLSVIDGTLSRLALLLTVITVGGGLLAGLATRLIAGRVLRPVRALTETVERVTRTQDLAAPVEVAGKDEIGRLSRSFAAMMGSLQESVGAQRRLVADASHELRTPLTSLTTNLELLDEGAGAADPQAPALVRAAREQAGELRVLVNDLVDLARYGQAHPHTEDTRLDLLAERVVDRARARAVGLVFRTELTECLVHVDPDAVERAVSNLVNNAVKWSPTGGEVRVRVELEGTRWAGLTVSDQGPGIPPADLPFVFDRFYRAAAARKLPGSGLGLAIVRQVVETHGGTVVAEQLEVGVRLRIRLPRVS
jgi:two-component system sensor histidine kinase MprB